MAQELYICVTCGTQFAPTEEPPANCPICDDDRQYIGFNGQQWTTRGVAEGPQERVQ